MRREERYRRISPVIHETWGSILPVELEYRHELDRGNAEPLEIRDLLDHAGERAARLLRDARARMTGETRDVHLVHDGPRRRSPERDVAVPVVGRDVDDHALHRRSRVVAEAPGGVAAVGLGHHDPATIRIQENLARIEPHAGRRIERALD